MSDVLALTEHQAPDELDDTSYEMLDAGRDLAEDLGGDLVAVVLGDDTDPLIEDLGAADRVVTVEDDALAEFNPMSYAQAAKGVMEEEDCGVLLSSITSLGIDVVSRVGSDTDTPVITYVNEVGTNEGEVVATSQLYGGKMNISAKVDNPAIIGLAAGAYDADEGRESGSPDPESLSVDVSTDGISFVERHEPEAGDVDITQEDRLLAVGRGIDDEDNIPMAEDAAEAIDAELASSRPLIDNGWLPKSRQVGKSGQAVDPELYVAMGISGAPEHIEGMEDAETIVAINTDPDAPIFDHADYGISADLFDVLPELEDKA